MLKTEVLIIGAGPVGAMGAARLASMGIDVIICEQQATCAPDLRASTFHSATVEMLHEIGAAEALIERGLKSPVYQMRDRQSGEYIAFDLTELSDITKFPFRLQCEQFHMANLLTDRLPDMGNVEVHFNSKLISAEQNGEEVIATLEKDGKTFQIAAKFLVGADGSHSVVRKSMGVKFEGFTYNENFLSLSTEYPIESVLTDISYVNYISDPEEWLVLLRVPALWRILVPAPAGVTQAILTSDERVTEVFDRIVPGIDVTTAHRTIYRVHQRVAESFINDRMLLVGDAAHLNNPLGGFGMNSGVHDVWNLADKLWKILRKDGSGDLLDLFDRQRRTVTRNFIQAQTIANKAFMEQSSGERHAARMEEMRAIEADDTLRRAYLMRQSMFDSLKEAEAIQ